MFAKHASKMFAKHKLRSFRFAAGTEEKSSKAPSNFRAIRVKSTARKWHEDEIHTLRIVKEFDIIFIRCTYIRIDLYIVLERVDKCGFLLSLLSNTLRLKTSSWTWQQFWKPKFFFKGRRESGKRKGRKEMHEK